MGCFVSLSTIFILSATFVSGQNTTKTIDDNEMGMRILYTMVNTFLGDVIHKKKITESFLNLTEVFANGEFHSEEADDWRQWMEYLIGFSVCAAIGIAFIVIMPIAGVIFCCCRLCGRCGAKTEKGASKQSKCKRRSYCTVLMILTTVSLAGVVCAFICNSIVYKHVNNDDKDGTFGFLDQSLHQIEEFINNSVNGYSNYVNGTYQSTSQDILLKVNDSATRAVEKVLDQLNATSLLADARDLSNKVNTTKMQLDHVSVLLSELSDSSEQLKQNLTDIRDHILQVCSKSSSSCQTFDVTSYNIDADFSSLNNLSSETNKVSEALDMHKYVVQAEERLNDAKSEAYDKVKDNIRDADKAIRDVGREIDNGIRNFQDKKNNLLEEFPSVYEKLDDGHKYAQDYSYYVYYGGVGVCCAYLLVIVLYYFGLLFGVCGEKPGDGAPCCNTGCGANFLMSGVAFTFIFSWILMIICVVLFCVGGPAYTEVCRYFEGHDPTQLKVFDDVLKNALKLDTYYNETPPGFSVSGVIRNCEENKALFSALQLDYIIDLNKTLDITQLKDELRDLKNTGIDVQNITILNGNLSAALTDLINAGLEKVNFTRYFSELSKQLTKGDLSILALQVETYARNETNQTDKDTLNESARRLRDLNDKTLPDMKAKVNQLNTSLILLRQTTTLKDAAIKLIDNLKLAETNFNTNKVRLIKEQIEQLADDIINTTSATINQVKNEVREKLYGCKNLSSAMFTMSDAACLLVLEPVNGLWFSFGWCLFFFVPCLIFAVLLAGQYRRTLEDDKEYEDPNYVLYGSQNPDTIPLTRMDPSSARSGMYNAGYRGEYKTTPYAEPPPYDGHMHSGIAAYAPPADHNYRHVRAAYGDGLVSGSRAKDSYSYPY